MTPAGPKGDKTALMASPELTQIVEFLRSVDLGSDESTVEERRARMETMAAAATLPEGTSVDAVEAGSVPAEWVSAPGADPGLVIMYLHGGAYVAGSLNTHRGLAARLSAAAGGFVFTVDYRLAPEHPHPAAVDDAVTAYRWLLEHGSDPTRMVIAGDSAGGGLTVATLLALRDAGDPMPAAAVCISPWTDLECAGESMTTKADEDPMIRPQSLADQAALYVGGGDPRAPLVSPIHADLSGLPPLLIHVGTAETLLDDATRLAAKAEAGGVDVTLETWDDMIHVWHAFEPLPEAREAVEQIGRFVTERTARVVDESTRK